MAEREKANSHEENRTRDSGAVPREKSRNDRQSRRSRNTARRTSAAADREAAETVRTMREKDEARRSGSAREKRRRMAEIRSRVTMISALIIAVVTGIATLFGMQTLRENEEKRAAEMQLAAEIEANKAAEEQAAEKAAAEEEARREAASGKMSGGIAAVKIKADNPEDVDGDGIANQQDIFQSAKEYVATKPIYEDRYYQTGYPDDEYGVCTDVVGFAFLGAGFNLQMLVKSDIEEHIEDYPEMETPDPKIDFRRVKNLDVFFQHTAEILPTSLEDLSVWQPGDIVTWERHIGIISDRKNDRGVPYVIHHAGVSQTEYEEDILEGKSRYTYVREITGHYRVS